MRGENAKARRRVENLYRKSHCLPYMERILAKSDINGEMKARALAIMHVESPVSN